MFVFLKLQIQHINSLQEYMTEKVCTGWRFIIEEYNFAVWRSYALEHKMTQPLSINVARFMEADLSTRMFRVTSSFNEALYVTANEPSLGMYRIQEHIAMKVPRLVEERRSLQDVCQQVQGACFDMEYDVQALRCMGSITQFATIRDNLRSAIELKARLDEVAAQRRPPLQSDRPTTSSLRDYGSISQKPPPVEARMFHTVDGNFTSNMLGIKETVSSSEDEDETQPDPDPDIKPKSFD